MREVIGIDLYNQTTTGRVSKTMNSVKSDSDHVPCVLIGDRMKQVKASGFDQGASRDVGVLFLPEVAKTLSNGSCPGHHNGVVQALNGGCWTIDEQMGNTWVHEDFANTLTVRSHKQPQAVIYETDRNDSK